MYNDPASGCKLYGPAGAYLVGFSLCHSGARAMRVLEVLSPPTGQTCRYNFRLKLLPQPQLFSANGLSTTSNLDPISSWV